MDEYLLIDGYNIVNAWPELKKHAVDNLDNARNRLVDIILDFQGYKGYKVIIVFDAHMIKGGIEKSEVFGDIEVIYTKENETADHYIERWMDIAPKYIHVMVATSDSLQQTIVLSKGAVRVSARELLEQVKQARKEMGNEYLNKLRPKSNTLRDLASPDVIEILERWRRQR